MVVSVAFAVTCEIVTVAFPLFVSVTLFELETPALTLPKLKLVGASFTSVPVPLRLTFCAFTVALSVKVSAPVRALMSVGVKVTLT